MIKKALKVLLKMNQLTPKTNLYNAQIDIVGNMNVENIISEMLVEQPHLKYDAVLEIINGFNTKVMEKLMNGYTINTGLVNVRPTLKNSLTGNKWNPYTNSVCLKFSENADVRDAMSKVAVEIEEEFPDIFEVPEYTIRNKRTTSTKEGNRSAIGQPDDLSSISAFRNWLMKP